ncbi:MAG TPA: hypothetical protein PLT92_11555, partial [Ignavibacteriaceae bacterium]|nr:hypothetical protein [Ignavibacteriaceae bacterium]
LTCILSYKTKSATACCGGVIRLRRHYDSVRGVGMYFPPSAEAEIKGGFYLLRLATIYCKTIL